MRCRRRDSPFSDVAPLLILPMDILKGIAVCSISYVFVSVNILLFIPKKRIYCLNTSYKDYKETYLFEALLKTKDEMETATFHTISIPLNETDFDFFCYCKSDQLSCTGC